MIHSIQPPDPALALPCPLCGATPQTSARASTWSATKEAHFIVCYCQTHSARVHIYADSAQEALRLWNTRPTQPTQPTKEKPTPKFRSKPGKVPKQAPGKIRVAWATTPSDGPDWFGVWEKPADKPTCKYLLTYLPPIFKELVARGYDPHSIRFECAKLPPNHPPS